MNAFQGIHSDFRRYRAQGLPTHYIFLMQGFWAMFYYRISHSWFHASSPVARKILKFPARILQTFSEALTHICLPPACEIGKGLHISHFNVFVGTTAHVGDYCSLHQGVTLGRAHNKGAFPTLKNRVFVGANALILGEITIENDVVIAAGAVVTHSIPARAVAVGNPAKIISYRGSFDLIQYEGMNEDKDRLQSLELAEK